ncbi:hypothetical protein JCM11491_005227 [Sporobolomyces phaffii]
MDDLLHTRKKPRTDDTAQNPSNSVPPSAPSSTTSNSRQIHSVVYAGYEIQAQFSAPYPWDDLVKEMRSRKLGNEKDRPSSRGDSARARRDSNSGIVKNRRPTRTAFGAEPRGTGEDAKTKHSRSHDNDSLSSLSSSEDDVAPPPKRRARSGPGRKKPRPGDDEAGIASFSTFPPPPPSPPLSPEVVEDIPPPPPPPPPARSSAQLTEPVLPKTEESELAFQAILANDPRVLSRDTSPHSASSHDVTGSTEAMVSSAPIASTSTAPIPSREATASPASSIASSKLANGGRSVPNSTGTTTQAQQDLARTAAVTAAASSSADPVKPKALTQRQQRENKRIEREAKEREERERKEKEGGGKDEERRLWVCERCFKYMADLPGWKAHQKDCNVNQPPGRRVYQRGATSIWEVDGAVAKLYCQNLCLFAKLFIEHKYMFFDVEGFSFYLLTESMGKQEWVLGYFSKEKVSYDDYNLACIVVFPPFRQKGWATLLIEFSYELSRRLSHTPGTPERPLSDLGQAGYLSHWTSVLVRYFRSIFANHVEPPFIDDVIEHARALELEALYEPENDDGAAATSLAPSPPSLRRPRKPKLKPAKGWVGELAPGAGVALVGQYPALTLRATRDGEALGRVDAAGEFDFGPSELESLADKVNLQVEDVAWALVESGLAQWRTKTIVEQGGGGAEEMVVITPELVEAVAEKKKVKKKPMLDVGYVCM